MKNLMNSLIFLILLSTFVFAQSTTIQLPTNTNASDFTITKNDGTELLKMLGGGQFYIKGTFGNGQNTITGAGTRLVWYPKIAAFRAGYVDGDQWDDPNINSYSTAMGYNTTASGEGSVAMGYNVIASGNRSVALGDGNTASGNKSFAAGETCVASGVNSFAFGENSTASGNYSIALIAGTSGGDASMALGHSATASANYSTAIGYRSNASALDAIATGYETTSSGEKSFSMGKNTTAQSYCSVVIGKQNVIEGTTDSWVNTEPLFVCGNGTAASPSNALTLLKNGNMTIAGTLTENSDIRLKENITPLKDVLTSLENITPVYYEFKNKETHPDGKHIGFIAQEIEKEFPELVSKDSRGYLSVEYTNMTAILLQTIKELKTEKDKQVTELKKKNEELEKRMAKLEAIIFENQSAKKIEVVQK